MLADSSSNTVSNAFPAGGGTGSIQVGFSSTPSTTAQPLVISPTIPHQRRRLMPNGRRHEYTAVVTTAASATVSHNTGEISGSNVRVNMIAQRSRNQMAEDFRLPILDVRLNRSPHSQSKIENQKSAQEDDAITDNDINRLTCG